MAGHLLDTSIAILLRDGDPDTIRRAQGLMGAVAISAIGRVELEGGVDADPMQATRRRERLDAFLQGVTVLPFEDRHAAAYSRIVAARGYSRRKVIDRMIAATAIVHDITLVTMNGADFADVPGLKLEAWG